MKVNKAIVMKEQKEGEQRSFMFYLLLAIICSASIALIFKYTETRKTNRYVITSANYFMLSL